MPEMPARGSRTADGGAGLPAPPDVVPL